LSSRVSVACVCLSVSLSVCVYPSCSDLFQKVVVSQFQLNYYSSLPLLLLHHFLLRPPLSNLDRTPVPLLSTFIHLLIVKKIPSIHATREAIHCRLRHVTEARCSSVCFARCSFIRRIYCPLRDVIRLTHLITSHSVVGENRARMRPDKPSRRKPP
jgi:hypothetical protein